VLVSHYRKHCLTCFPESKKNVNLLEAERVKLQKAEKRTRELQNELAELSGLRERVSGLETEKAATSDTIKRLKDFEAGILNDFG
jgi:flagellar motility protein MotE (MotC chaperone)